MYKLYLIFIGLLLTALGGWLMMYAWRTESISPWIGGILITVSAMYINPLQLMAGERTGLEELIDKYLI
jgi:uncharacterized membrane protein